MNNGVERSPVGVGNVTVPTVYFRARRLPSICVMSGRTTVDVVEVRAKSPIGLQWLLLLLGVFPLVLVRVLTIKRATGYLPLDRGGDR